MHIVVIPGTNYNNAPAGFSATVDYVVNLFDNLYTANVTVYINVDYGQIDSTNATVPPLGKSNWNLNSFSYSTVRQALINMGAPGSNTLSVRRHVMADHGASEGVGAASCDVPTRQRLSLSRRGWLRGGSQATRHCKRTVGSVGASLRLQRRLPTSTTSLAVSNMSSRKCWAEIRSMGLMPSIMHPAIP